MEIILYFLMFFVSLGALIKSSDWFVMAAEAIGKSWGASPFIIGLTIVAFGTSLPELATAVFAVLEGQSEIALGNVIGSNITNIFLVLGLLAVFASKIDLDFDLFRSDIPALVISAFLFWFMIQDGDINTMEALIMILALGVFVWSSFSDMVVEEEYRIKAGWKSYLLLIFGGTLVYFSAKYTVDSIVLISNGLNLGTDVVSLTVVALGTSLPEVAVSLTAAKRGNAGIAVGNVIGSNIFNTYFVVGVAALVGPLSLTESLADFSLPLMVAATVILAVSSLSKQITRWEGYLYLLFYLYFVYYLFI
nr:calcium/sodium antiporter [Saprospiraceae bacterium]